MRYAEEDALHPAHGNGSARSASVRIFFGSSGGFFLVTLFLPWSWPVRSGFGPPCGPVGAVLPRCPFISTSCVHALQALVAKSPRLVRFSPAGFLASHRFPRSTIRTLRRRRASLRQRHRPMRALRLHSPLHRHHVHHFISA